MTSPASPRPPGAKSLVTTPATSTAFSSLPTSAELNEDAVIQWVDGHPPGLVTIV